MASVFKRGGKGKRGAGYYIQWFDHNGKRQSKSARTTDKATAERIAAKLEADAALRRDGVIDPTLDAIGKESQRSIESHLKDYESKLRAAGRSDEHVSRTIGFVRKICEWAGFSIATDTSADDVNRYAGKLRDDGRSSRTIQAHLTAIKGFTKWLGDNHKLPRDPLSSVKKPNPKADRRRERRMLLPEEWCRVKAATKFGQERYGITGAERVLLYETAIQSGLRSNELRSLTRGRLYFDSDPPYVTAKAGNTKNRKDARQFIQPELAAELRAHIATKTPKAPVFKLPHETNMAAMLRADLTEARKQWLNEAIGDPQEYARREESDLLRDVNHEGYLIDFHALRHTCGAWFAMTGAHPKVVQQVMRHSTITLTMDTYGHLFPGQEADAVAGMRDVLFTLPEALRATGTDNSGAEVLKIAQHEKSAALAQQLGCETVRSGCDVVRTAGNDRAPRETPKPLRDEDLCDVVRRDASKNESRPGRTRTRDQGIMSPLL